MLEIDPEGVGTLWLDSLGVPYVYLEGIDSVQARLRLGETEYAYERSYPVKGHSAVMPQDARELMEQGKRLLVAERGERFYVYLARGREDEAEEPPEEA